jgi:hypothetical protein
LPGHHDRFERDGGLAREQLGAIGLSDDDEVTETAIERRASIARAPVEQADQHDGEQQPGEHSLHVALRPSFTQQWLPPRR